METGEHGIFPKTFDERIPSRTSLGMNPAFEEGPRCDTTPVVLCRVTPPFLSLDSSHSRLVVTFIRPITWLLHCTSRQYFFPCDDNGQRNEPVELTTNSLDHFRVSSFGKPPVSQGKKHDFRRHRFGHAANRGDMLRALWQTSES